MMNNKTVYYKPAPPKPATVLVIEGNRSVRTIQLNGDTHIGRLTPESVAELKLSSGIVSRDHGEFLYIDGEYYYKDNNSLNGTYYNGVFLEKMNERGSRSVKLRDGDVLRIDRRNLDVPHPDAVEIIFSTIFSPDERWYRFDLINKEHLSIGRDASCDIRLSDFMISGIHAKLEGNNGKWEIVDNKSKNGVAVNNNTVSDRQKLNKLDVIRIADSTIIFMGDYVLFSDGKDEQNKRFNYSTRSVIMNVNINEVKVKNYLLRKKTLLKDINLDIEAGDFILILGGSGAGKTTFINSLLGDIRANGEILFKGMDLYKNFKMLKHKIGLVPQFSTTRDNDTVYHTIMDAAKVKLSADYSKDEIKSRVESIIQRMMLTSLRDNFIKTLSGGQKKRVEVAIQAIGDQEIFILDEPDSGMDYASRIDLMSNLKSCTSNGGVVSVISHSPDDAAKMFTKVIVLAKSRTDEVGHLAYYGDVPNALAFFGVQKLSEIVMEINYEGGKGRADEFIRKFESSRRN